MSLPALEAIPGSALLFPSLCAPTSELSPRKTTHADSGCTDRTAMMPRRHRTRAQNLRSTHRD
jgi:hypothetical protein